MVGLFVDLLLELFCTDPIFSIPQKNPDIYSIFDHHAYWFLLCKR